MDTVNMPATRRLALGELTADLRLIRLLPREIEFRYHVLPVAEDKGRITVAMANPDDITAQAAVVDALGMTPYIVKGDQETIDATLQLWPEESPSCLNLLVHSSADQEDDECTAYARFLGQLLGAKVSFADRPEDLDALARQVADQRQDLVICGEQFPPLIRRLMAAPQDSHLSRLSPTSLLLVRGCRRSINRILWVIRPDTKETNDAAFSWIARLVKNSSATVNVLAVVPPVPVMYGGNRQMRQGISSLLSTNTVLGKKLCLLARRMVDEEIVGTIRLRQGPPETQLRLEVDTTDPDLIVLSAEPEKSWKRWITGEQVNPLLRWADRPVLIAKPSPAEG